MTRPSHADAAGGSVTVSGAMPILRVVNFAASIAHYAGVLGFEVDWNAHGAASVRRGSASLMLVQGDQGHAGTWVYVSVSDADALYEELRGRGANIRQAPTNFPWGAREMQAVDIDGHVLRFGSDAAPGAPNGEWIDGSGVRWAVQSDGSWRATT